VVNHSASRLLGEVTSLRNVARGWVLAATVGARSAASASSEPLPAAVDRLPFRSRCGTLAGRIANRLAGVYHAFDISADHYT